MSAVFRVGSHSGPGVKATPPAGAPGRDSLELYFKRLLKLIPSEVIALYLTGQGLIPADERLVLAIWAAFCLAGVVYLRARWTADPTAGTPTQWGTVVVSAISFCIWVYAMGGPFASYGLHVPYIGSLLVLAWTFVVPKAYLGDDA